MADPASIVVAVAFDETSAHAVALAGTIAAKCGATLTLLHAERIDAPSYFTHDQMDALEHQRRRAKSDAEVVLAKFGRQHTRTPFAVVVVDRNPADAILHAARSADLVVMGTHGRRGAARWWLGSVAERVLRNIESPLVIVEEHEGGPPAAFIHVPAAVQIDSPELIACARSFATKETV